MMPSILFFIVGTATDNFILSGLGAILFILIVSAFFIPGLAVSSRRLHEIDKSAWFIFVNLVAYIGGIIILVWMSSVGDYGRNQYGPDPKSLNGGIDDHLV